MPDLQRAGPLCYWLYPFVITVCPAVGTLYSEPAMLPLKLTGAAKEKNLIYTTVIIYVQPLNDRLNSIRKYPGTNLHIGKNPDSAGINF